MNNKIQQQRKLLGWSLREAAKRIGVSAPYLHDVEKGKRQPSPETRRRLLEVLQIPLDEHNSVERNITQTATKPKQILSEETFIHLASGIVETYETTVEKGLALTAPYFDKLQMAFDRVVCACLLQERHPPQSIADLLHLCEQPFKEWDFGDLPKGISLNDSLLCRDLPTQLCFDYARQEADLAAALSEEKFMNEVRAACADKPDTYVFLRRTLIEKPVLTEHERRKLAFSNPLNRVPELLMQAYEENAPLYMSTDGYFFLCPTCRDLLVKNGRGEWYCREESCEQLPLFSIETVQKVAVSERVKQLSRALRRYVAAPGRAELRLEKTLKRAGAKTDLNVELYPFLDAYDLRLKFADGEAWAVDVKDWANPFLLAQDLKKKERPFRSLPQWERAFFVFPEHRRRQNRQYLDIFKANYPLLPEQKIEAVFEKDFLKTVRRRLGEK
jgi:transcriptional regulator with XRE-family HTH domain